MGNLSHIKIKGFKSIKALDLKMKPINVLIVIVLLKTYYFTIFISFIFENGINGMCSSK
jgi:hypothetical protein